MIFVSMWNLGECRKNDILSINIMEQIHQVRRLNWNDGLWKQTHVKIHADLTVSSVVGDRLLQNGFLFCIQPQHFISTYYSIDFSLRIPLPFNTGPPPNFAFFIVNSIALHKDLILKEKYKKEKRKQKEQRDFIFQQAILLF